LKTNQPTSIFYTRSPLSLSPLFSQGTTPLPSLSPLLSFFLHRPGGFSFTPCFSRNPARKEEEERESESERTVGLRSGHLPSPGRDVIKRKTNKKGETKNQLMGGKVFDGRERRRDEIRGDETRRDEIG
jgi:hypothetical protein